MWKLFLWTMFALLAFQTQAQAQIVIKRCPGGSTVSGNSSCPQPRAQTQSRKVYRQVPPRYTAVVHVPGTKYFTWITKTENQENKEYIIRSTLNLCQQETGANNCQVVLLVKDACFAIAAGPSFYATALDLLGRFPTQRALDVCRGSDNHQCVVVGDGCTNGMGSDPKDYK